jgi:hypothetical protein
MLEPIYDLGVHGGDDEEFSPLGYKNPIRTSQ